MSKNAAQNAQRVAQGEAGVLHLGFTAGSALSLLPQVLEKTNAQLKDIEIVLHEMVPVRQVEALHGHEIDAGLLRTNSELRDLELVRVVREPMMLAIPRSHRLAKGRMPRLNDLRGESFITFNPVDGQYFCSMVDGLFKSAGIPVKYVQRLGEFHSILALVSARQGLALVPQSAGALHFDGVVMRRLKESSIFAEIFLAWRKDNPNPALPKFRSLMLKHFGLPLAKLSQHG
jgi:DNA-binding transcriptional LysR family regulator